MIPSHQGFNTVAIFTYFSTATDTTDRENFTYTILIG